jgi:hypothetical protein
MITKAETLGKTKKPCQCFTSPMLEYGEGETSAETVYGSCNRLTGKRFAPGHDARLKGLLLKLARQDGLYVRQLVDRRDAAAPSKVLADLGWSHFLDVTQPKPKRTPSRPRFCKVGRWIYETVEVAPINLDGKHDVTYKASNGELATAFVKPEHLYNKKPV